MYFNIHAFLDEDYRTIFHGTAVYIPRIGEEVVFESCVYKITNVRHLLCEGKNFPPEIQLYLKQKI